MFFRCAFVGGAFLPFRSFQVSCEAIAKHCIQSSIMQATMARSQCTKPPSLKDERPGSGAKKKKRFVEVGNAAISFAPCWCCGTGCGVGSRSRSSRKKSRSGSGSQSRIGSAVSSGSSSTRSSSSSGW